MNRDQGDSVDGLLAGCARAEITPPVGQPMGGYLGRLREDGGGCHGVHDPLYARVLILRQGGLSVAIVSLDLLLFASARVVAEAKGRWDLDQVLLCSTHTHAGPIPRTGGLPEWSDLESNPDQVLDFEAFADDPWYAETETKILWAIGEAMETLFPARLAVGEGACDLAHNRRLVHDDGRITMLWADPDGQATGPVDSTLGVVRVDDASGQRRAVLVHYGCHPVTLGQNNRLISADFPGALTARLEAELGEGAMAMFLQGAQGDIDPRHCVMSGEAAFEAIDRMGETLATEAWRVVNELQPKSMTQLRADQQHVRLAQRDGGTCEAAMATVQLGDELALVALPGEPFVAHQLALRDVGALPRTWLLGLGYSGGGASFLLYLATRQAAAEGGYGADGGTFLAAGAAEQLLEHACETLTRWRCSDE